MSINKFYNENPRVYNNMDSAFKCESKTRQTPFVVASEILVEETVSREYLVFHDVNHYLMLRNKYPHCHEIIYGKDDDSSDRCGRLVFDFDGKLSNIPNNFESEIEELVSNIFELYYVDVDISKLEFIWLKTDYSDKYSAHLVVKNAYFMQHWDKQMKLFYTFMKHHCKDEKILNMIDFQVARRNATMRMVGCSKITSMKPILPVRTDLSIFDCFIGLYRIEDRKAEQCVELCDIDYDYIADRIHENPSQTRTLSKAMDNELSFSGSETSYIVTEEDEESAIDVFEKWHGNDCFKIRSSNLPIINLTRICPGECPISGRIHENENAYLKVMPDGKILFRCYRGCKTQSGKYSAEIGSVKCCIINEECEMKLPEGIKRIPIHRNKISKVMNTVCVLKDDTKPKKKLTSKYQPKIYEMKTQDKWKIPQILCK